jgi:hypothetical protein
MGYNQVEHLVKLDKKNDQWFFNQIGHPMLVNMPS